MLFQPTNEFDIIKDNEFCEKMPLIENTLEQYANRGYFKSFDGAEMFYEYFMCNQPRASVVIVHGYTEFTKKYYEMCWYFLNMGYNIFLYDLRGHGFSHRIPKNTEVTHVDNFEDYVKDLDCFINQIVNPNSQDLPVHLFSHSMGGAISAMYLATCTNTVKKAILSAPMVYPVCTPIPRQVLRMLLSREAKKHGWETKFRYSSDFNPDAKFENSHDLCKERFQHNLDMRIREMNYRNSSGSNRWNYEILGVMDKLLNRKLLSCIHSKMLIITAGKDTIVKKRPQLRLAKLLGCEHICFENAKHALYTMPDDNLNKYMQTILDFFS